MIMCTVHHWQSWKVEHSPSGILRDFFYVKSTTGSLRGDGATFELHNLRSGRAAESLGASGETSAMI